MITLYKNRSENNEVYKDISRIREIDNYSLQENTSVINPAFDLFNVDITNFNYVYISEFGRYYYVEDIISIAPGMVRVVCSVDVLMSFKNIVLNSDGILSRRGDNRRAYLQDRQIAVQINKKYEYFWLGNNDFTHTNNWSYILVSA